MSHKINDIFLETKKETEEENSLSSKVYSWAKELEDVLKRNKVTGRDIFDIAESDGDYARGN